MQMEAAARYLFKASLIDRGTNYPDIYYLLAEAYRGRVATTAKLADTIIKRSSLTKEIKAHIGISGSINRSKRTYGQCKNSLGAKGEMTPIDLQFNTPASEFAPRINNGQLYFTSLRADSTQSGNIVLDRQYYSKLYYSNLNEQTKAESLVIAGGKEFFKNRHIANTSISKDGKRAYFSVCDTNYNCSNLVRLNI